VKRWQIAAAGIAAGAAFALAGCGRQVKAEGRLSAGAGPEPGKVIEKADGGTFTVDHPSAFPLFAALEYKAAPELNVTGVVSPDVSRQVPVPSLATGRIVEINARLGDTVRKGQLLFRVRSSDIAGAYSDYRKSVKNEQLTKVQLDRAKLLYGDGAIPKSALEIAQNAEDNALVDLDTTTEHLRLLGASPDHPSGIVDVYAPESGVITDQEITLDAGVQALTPPNPFTISNLDHVWIVCDVYENDLAQVRIGDTAEIRIDAYPDRILKARVNNILPLLDPNIRTAKVRLELANPGILRFGMFVTATFHGQTERTYALVPETAILHLHDRDWVYVPADGGFRRVAVTSGDHPGRGMQEIVDGIKPGDKVVTNALVLQNTVEQ
jgi:cobalt-zinc-cadmium efflux system membrane fusion protein